MDTNSYDAAQELMPIIAKLARQAHSLAVGNVQAPVERLMKAYKSILPTQAEFAQQTKKVEEHYHQCHEILSFSALIAEVYPEGAVFAAMMEGASDPARRKLVISQIRVIGGATNTEALNKYEAARKQTSFHPQTLAQFEARSPDFSMAQVKKMIACLVGE